MNFYCIHSGKPTHCAAGSSVCTPMGFDSTPPDFEASLHQTTPPHSTPQLVSQQPSLADRSPGEGEGCSAVSAANMANEASGEAEEGAEADAEAEAEAAMLPETINHKRPYASARHNDNRDRAWRAPKAQRTNYESVRAHDQGMLCPHPRVTNLILLFKGLIHLVSKRHILCYLHQPDLVAVLPDLPKVEDDVVLQVIMPVTQEHPVKTAMQDNQLVTKTGK